MSMKIKRAAVDAAQADSAARRIAVTTAWNRLKQETERAATPGRVIGAGLIAGFVSGLRGPKLKSSGEQIGGKLFGMVIDGAFASFGAAMAAGAAAANAEHATTDASNSNTSRRDATDSPASTERD